MAASPSPIADGYTWSGSLDETDIRALYAACQSLRFSGRLELRDGATHAQVTFIGGEPIEITGGDTQRIALWNRGQFCAQQSIPNLAGELTSEREMAGSLSQIKASQLWAWVGEYRLTCEIEIERPGSKAVVVFQNGHAESAQVNGMPELAALARVSSWADGNFHVRLRPLFIEGVVPTSSPIIEGAPPTDPRQFDVSRSIPMDLRNRPSSPLPKPASVTRGVTPALGTLAERERQASMSAPRQRSRSLTPPVPTGPRLRPPQTELVPRLRPRGRGPLWVAGAAIVLALGAGALDHFHLPPFSPPPKPIVEAPPPRHAAPPPVVAVAPHPAVVATKPVLAAPPTPAPATPPPAPVAPAQPESQAHTATAKHESREHTSKHEHERPGERLIARGRALLVDGHPHSALDLFRRAQRLRPNDPALRLFEAQAMGKLGRAELTFEGHGSALVDGHRFKTPRRLRLAAGPHLIDLGDGERDLTLKRGERRHLRVHR